MNTEDELQEQGGSEFVADEEVGPAAAEAVDSAEEERLLGFYDRLRRRILRTVEKRGGKLSANGVRVLLLVPDIFLLLVRLVMDRDVPAGTRALIGSVLAYFILPVDLLPEAILGGAGFLDDIVLATAVVTQAFGGELEPYARKHWSGPDDLRVVLRQVSESAQGIFGGRLHAQVQRMMGDFGASRSKSERDSDRD